MTVLVLVVGGLVLLSLCNVDGATTRVTCRPDSEASMCMGHQLDIVCEINGTIKTGIAWSLPGNEEKGIASLDVFLCTQPEPGQSQSNCYENGIPGYTIIENTLTRQVLRINNFTEKDLGKWSCRDGDLPTSQLCEVENIFVAPRLPHLLEASCKLLEDGGFNASCTRVDHWGAPAVDLILSIEDERQILNTSDGNFSIIKQEIGGKRVTCSLDGPSAVCLKNIDSVACASANEIGVIIGIILGVVVLIVVIVFVAVWWCRKSKHKEEEDIITGSPQGKDVKKPDEQRDLIGDSRAKEEP